MPFVKIEEMVALYGEAECKRAFATMIETGWAVLPDQGVLTRTGSEYLCLPLDILTEREGRP